MSLFAILRPRRPALGLSAVMLAVLAALPVAAQTTPAPEGGAAPAAEAAPSAADAAGNTAGDAAAEAAAGTDIVLGDANAPVTFIEYASFTCSHCGDFAKDSFPKLKADYIDTGKVKYIQRDVYFDAVGLWAGILAHCDPAKYYPIGQQLLSTQDKWLQSVKTADEAAENLRKVGLAAGMTTEQMDTCWKDENLVEKLVSSYQANATADGIEGTPTFIINGEKVPNQAWTKIAEVIDAKLADAGTDTGADTGTDAK